MPTGASQKLGTKQYPESKQSKECRRARRQTLKPHSASSYSFHSKISKPTSSFAAKHALFESRMTHRDRHRRRRRFFDEKKISSGGRKGKKALEELAGICRPPKMPQLQQILVNMTMYLLPLLSIHRVTIISIKMYVPQISISVTSFTERINYYLLK